MNFILFGFKSCGKTYYGKKIAEKLSLPFVETDLLIEDLYQKKEHEHLRCPQIYKKKGNAFFRDLEKEAIQSIQNKKNTVISLGGGAVLDPENARLLAKLGTLVYLKVDKETLKNRQLAKTLPSYIDSQNPEASFEKIYRERKEIYESLPAVWIDANQNEEEVLKALSSLIIGNRPLA